MSHYTDDFEQEYVDHNMWTKRDGTKIPIKKLTDQHILNIIKGSADPEWVDVLIAEATKRGLKYVLHPYYGCDATEADIY